MPYRSLLDSEPVPPREPVVRAKDVILGAMMLVICIALIMLFPMLQKILDNQAAGEQRTYQTRAVNCDLAEGIGVTEPKECQNPKVEQYRDPAVQPGSSASSRASMELKAVICGILQRPGSQLVLDPALCA